MKEILIGLDIGSQTIKAVQLSRQRNSYTLLAAGYIASPPRVMVSQTPGDEQALADTINRLIHDMKVSTADITASLPSSKVITRVIELPKMSESELNSSIQWEAEQYIPLPLSKVKIDYAIIDENPETNKMKVLLVAAPITVIERYMRVISLAGLNPVALETEILAASRSISVSFPTLDNVIVVSIGTANTEIALLYNQILVYTKTYPIGGNTLSRAIAQELGFEINQAEEYKKTYGLEEDKLEGKIAKSIMPFFNTIFSEMEKTIVYFKEQYPKSDIKTVVLCGGGAKLPGLVATLTKYLGVDSQISNPFMNLSVDPKILPSLVTDAPQYTVSIGLAQKEVD